MGTIVQPKKKRWKRPRDLRDVPELPLPEEFDEFAWGVALPPDPETPFDKALLHDSRRGQVKGQGTYERVMTAVYAHDVNDVEQRERKKDRITAEIEMTGRVPVVKKWTRRPPGWRPGDVPELPERS